MTGASVDVSDRNGAGMVTEIKGIVNDRVAVGGRVEVAVMFGGHVDAGELEVAMAACGIAKAEVFLTRRRSDRSSDSAPVVTRSARRPRSCHGRVATSVSRRKSGSISIACGSPRRTTRSSANLMAASQSYLSLELSFEFAR